VEKTLDVAVAVADKVHAKVHDNTDVQGHAYRRVT
jgi:hypothetical protein